MKSAMNSNECIEAQLFELELLMSMFPNKGELEFDDPSELADLRSLLHVSRDGTRGCHADSVGFTLRLTPKTYVVELTCRLPRNYPFVAPTVCARLPNVASGSRHQRDFSSALQGHIHHLTNSDESTSAGGGIINEIIQWINDNIDSYATDMSDDVECDGCRQTSSVNSKDFARLWIYSHHIYNRTKRRTILDCAIDLDLSGFCAPGKPGVVCVEGERSNAEEFWQRVRGLQWKRISLIHREDFSSSSAGDDTRGLRHFDGFLEKCFVSSSQLQSSRHMDRGLLLKFLQERECAYVFRFYFGIDGATAVAGSESIEKDEQGVYLDSN